MSTHNPPSNKDPDVVESIDDAAFNPPHVVIADITTDDAWIAMPTSNALPLEAWR